MDSSYIASKCDHTLLSVDATWQEIVSLCRDAISYNAASVCIPPSYVSSVKKAFGDKIKICTVIGFPNGYSTTATKCFETEAAIADGADEIDMVINVGWVKDKRFDLLHGEIKRINNICKKNDKILKVIIETCLLTTDEKVSMCGIISAVGADYIKTSTGFSTGGATVDDILLFKEFVNPSVKIKAAGGISSISDAQKFIEAGADRLGTSKVIKILKEEK